MSKRAPQFERKERDLYLTPPSTVIPLKRFIRSGSTFYEPCAADGGLVVALMEHLTITCLGMSDIEPLAPEVERIDALQIDTVRAAQFITNPPWKRDILHQLIEHLKWIAPTWLLLDADWLFTHQAAEYLPDATDIVAIGRVRWIPGTTNDGKDNACWVRFVGGHDIGARFHGNW